MKQLLHIDASGRTTKSTSRILSAKVIETLSAQYDNTNVIYRDTNQGLALVDDTMIDAYYTPKNGRSQEQEDALVLSNQIVQELFDSDTIVIGLPIYNFAMPASFKIWADLAARVGLTFQYTEQGPVGLLENKKAIVVITSGGTKLNSEIDFLTPWLNQYLGFIGITDVHIIAADGLGQEAEETLSKAESAIKALV